MSLARTLSSLVLCGALLALPATTGGAGEVRGLLGLEAVRRKATALHDIMDDDGFGRTRFFPDMRFMCSGTITQLVVISRPVNDAEGLPTFHLVKETNNVCLETLAGVFNFITFGGGGIEVYSFTLSPPVEFQDGDSFAISQEEFSSSAYTIQYYSGEMPGSRSVALEIDTEDSDSGECLIRDSRSEYQAALAGMLSTQRSIPLLAVTETNAPECVEGFVSRETLNNLLEIGQVLPIRANEGRQLLYPGDITTISGFVFGSFRIFPIESIQFTCNGELRRWTVGAERRAGGRDDRFPQFQIWRRTGNNGTTEYQYVRQQFTTIRPSDLVLTESLSAYEVVVDPPLSFQEGDVLGLFQPRDSQVVLNFAARQFFRSGHPNYRNNVNEALAEFTVNVDAYNNDDIPILHPEVISSSQSMTSNEDCVSTFYSRNTVIDMAQFISPDPQTSTKQHIIPDIAFSSSGMLTSITFAASYNSQASNAATMLLQVWRLVSSGTQATLMHSTAIVQPTPTSHLNMYEFIVEPPLPVSAGDVLGIYTPEGSQFSMLFADNSGPLNYMFNSLQQQTAVLGEADETEYMAPFLVVNIDVENSGSVTTNPPTTSQSTTDAMSPLPMGTLTPLPADQSTTNAITPLLMGTLTPLPPDQSTTNAITPLLMGTMTPLPADPADRGGGLGSIVAGVVVALLLVGLAISAVIVAIVLVRRKRKRQGSAVVVAVTADSNGTALDNPVYAGNVEESSADDKQPPVVYEAVGSGYTRPPTVPQLPVEYAVVDPIQYETPESYSRLWGVVVPTKEQREGNTVDHIYSTLTECAAAAPDFFEEAETFWEPGSDYHTLYQQLACRRYREILRPQICVKSHLGSGQFGTVSRGEWHSPEGVQEVAIKTLRAGSKQEDAVKFLQEAAINGQFRHPNVVKLTGVVTVGEPAMIVLELLANGDLRKYLLKMSAKKPDVEPVEARTLLGFSQDVARGMEYLSGKKFVHRDLAARNILVAADMTCKVSDFGMSRDLSNETYYISHGGQVPVKWTAPEAIHFKKYSTASDVWSFGAVMYEIWSVGHKPFEGYTNAQALRMVDKGFRLPPPPGCPKAIYSMMIQCWNAEKSARPSFSELVNSLSVPASSLLHRKEEEEEEKEEEEKEEEEEEEEERGGGKLGAALETANNLYVDLQRTYLPGGDYD